MRGAFSVKLFFWSTSPKGTFVFLEGFVDEHVSLHFVLPVERRLTEGALVWLFTQKTKPASSSHCYFDQPFIQLSLGLHDIHDGESSVCSGSIPGQTGSAFCSLQRTFSCCFATTLTSNLGGYSDIKNL